MTSHFNVTMTHCFRL